MKFKYCPKCSSEKISFDNIKQYKCPDCGFVYFHNVAAAAAVILEYENKILLIVRNKAPQKNKLDLAGGFVDPNESARQAVLREVKEELNVTVKNLKYFGSYPNTYKYMGVTYNTCDIIFTGSISRLPVNVNDEIKQLKLLKPKSIKLKDIAFTSSRQALADYIALL
jgi:NAD+ diphosphatase